MYGQEDDLEERHQANIGEELATKGETTKDLDLMFEPKGRVNFRKKGGGGGRQLKGRWCMTCKLVFHSLSCSGSKTHTCDRSDAEHVETAGLRKCFLTGGNSTLRQHCRQHYPLYKERCEKAGVPINHHAIPPKLAKMMAKEKKEKLQMKLDDTYVTHREVFTREAVLHAVAQFVACDDQVSTMLDVKAQYLPVHPSACLRSSRRLLLRITSYSGTVLCQ